jgi:hypothetical protein
MSRGRCESNDVECGLLRSYAASGDGRTNDINGLPKCRSNLSHLDRRFGIGSAFYESGGQRFESFRARHFRTEL